MAPYMSGEFVIFSVLSCSSKNLKQWTDHCYSSMLQLSFIGQAKENTSSRHEGGLTQKTRREEKTEAQFWLLFLCFFLPALSLPYVNWSSQEGCLFYLRSSLWFSDLCSIFTGFSLLCFLATTTLDFFFLF